MGAGAHLVDEVLRRGELVQLDQRLGPLQDDVGVADEREVRVAALPVDQFALEETHVLAVAVVGRGALVEPEVAAAGSLQVERPAELLADHVLVAVESRREAVHRFVGGDDRLLEPRVALVVGGLDPGLVAVVEVVAVEDVLPADADRLGLLRRQLRVAFQPVAAEEHGPLSGRQLVPVLKPGHLAPFELRAVVVLVVVDEIRRRFHLVPAAVGVAGAHGLLDVVAVAGLLVVLDGEDHLVVALVVGAEEVDVLSPPEVVAALADLLEIVGGVLPLLEPHVGHAAQGVGGAFRRAAEVALPEGVVGERRVVDAVFQVGQYHFAPHVFGALLRPRALLVGDRLEVDRDALPEFVQAGVGPGPEEPGLAEVTLVGRGVQSGLVQVRDGVVGGVHDRVAEPPFVRQLPVVGALRLIVEQVDRVVVGVVVGAESQGFDAVLVESVEVLRADLRAVALFAVVERLVESVHALQGEFGRGPHVLAGDLVFRGRVEQVHA